MLYYEVAPTIVFRTGTDSLTYASELDLTVGTIVEIELGKKSTTGVIISPSSRPDYDTKQILRVIDETPLPAQLIETAHWMSLYYATPLATVLQTLLPRGLTKKRHQTSKKLRIPSRKRTNFVLNTYQESAIKQISEMNPGTALLHGVTGSGKTRVYIELARQSLDAGSSVIILVPEIALTSQLVDEFQSEFGDIIVTHSRQTEATRHQAWLDALHSTSPRVVVGPRSALFLPLVSVGLIVIDECHEPSYKQEQSPRYSALLAAHKLAQAHNAKLILGSATPPISEYYQLLTRGRPVISMPSPARTDTISPAISLIDMTKRTNFTRHRFFSDALLSSVEAVVSSGHQALIFHNRRGTSSTTLCENCGWQAGCPKCFVPLTLHADAHRLICHICSTNMPVPTSCPECGHVDIIHRGIGTKLIESEITKLFPDKKIARFDGDTHASQTVDQRYAELYDGSIDIIIGTQVIAKGLDLPHLRTVGVVQADAGLSLPDYSAPERTFQLLAQVIGRVGRSEHPTTVIVQSYQPNHPAVRDGISQNYDEFYDRTIALREHTHFPPFRFLLKLTCTYKTETTAIKNAQALANTLRQTNLDIEILGPTPAFYERVRDSYRWQIVVRSASRQNLIDTLAYLPPKSWQFELDPISLL